MSAAEAKECVLGCTCGNDVSERDWQKSDLQWWRAKGCDTFAPLGPAIAVDFDWSRSGVQTRVNGNVVQSGRFSELLFDPPTIVSHVSQYVTLLPGDVIYTGTPGSTRAMRPGDQVEVEIEGIGVLRNSVGIGLSTEHRAVRERVPVGFVKSSGDPLARARGSVQCCFIPTCR